MHLEALPLDSLPKIHELFMKSVDREPNLDLLKEEMIKSEKLIEEKIIPFDYDKWIEYRTDYQKKGYPAVSHCYAESHSLQLSTF